MRRNAGDDLIQLCSFALGGEHYVIDIMRIKEIINPVAIRKVPKAPPFVEGVIDLRGAIIPIVDVRKRLGVPVKDDQRGTKYIIISVAGRIVGLVVDAVREILRVPRSELRPAPALALDERMPVVAGVCSHEGQLLLLLDLDELLSGAEREGLAGAADAAGALPAGGAGEEG
jgi:purine-binding chemotaxis protein CheW